MTTVWTRRSILTLAVAAAMGAALPALAADPIKIGLVTALSGQSARAGEAITRGLTIAIDELNASGGVLGPPHAWNVDFPHLMLRAKAVKFRRHGAGFRDRLLSSTDAMGKLAAIPVVAQTVNAVNRTPLARSLMEKTLDVHKDRQLPPYASSKFRSSAASSKPHAAKEGKNTPGKVAVYATCYVNYNEPGMGHDLLALLEHNEVPYVLVEKEACCGMPKLELGDLEAVEKLKDINIPPLAKLARDGYAILTPIPSGNLYPYYLGKDPGEIIP